MAIDRQLLFELSHFLMIDFPSIPFHRALHLPFDDISFACPPSNEMNDFLRFRDPKNWQRRIVQCESRFWLEPIDEHVIGLPAEFVYFFSRPPYFDFSQRSILFALFYLLLSGNAALRREGIGDWSISTGIRWKWSETIDLSSIQCLNSTM